MQKSLRILCKASLDIAANSAGIKWLIGASFLPFTIISSVNCLHVSEDDPFLPRYSSEAEVLQELLPRGLEIVGAFFIGSDNGVDNAKKAGKVALEMRKCLVSDDSFTNSAVVITKDPSNINHFVYNEGTDPSVEGFETVVYQEHPSQYLWNTACLVRCKCLLKLPVYLSSTKSLGDHYALVQEEFIRNLKGSKTVFQVDTLANRLNKCSPVLLRFKDTGGQFSCVVVNKMTENVNSSNLAFSNLCSTHQYLSVAPEVEIPKPINVSILLHSSCGNSKAHAPIIEYFPAKEDVEIMLLSITLDVLCVSSMESSLAESVSNLIIPGLIYQLAAAEKFLSARVKQPKLHTYHFCPRGFLHPVTAVYDMSMGETEINQVHLREKLHARLNLPVDRPMLRAANALNLEVSNSIVDDPTRKRGQKRLTNVHHGLSNSGVAGGQISLVDGTYDYYHYLQDDIDDNGWGCAYRSLQTIISWFRNQHYTSLNVPSHRKIQETLVEIGDKEPGFIGSKEWIGAIELSFVLDKLLGVSCKILNVRSGIELPEKCRELALHFSTQGTPVMIGGGVLAYTLLGVDFNSATGDCAFLILDPHYTGADDLRSIQSAGWCGWKKAISSKGKEFFLRDKFYNLLLPQRPNMV